MNNYLKKIVVIGILVVLLTSSVYAIYIPVKGNPNDYTDIKEHWAYNNISYVISNGFFKGITKTEFMPNLNMTRATLVTVLWRLTGEDLTYTKTTETGTKKVNRYVNMFWDMDDDGTYTNYVAWANYNKIISGYSKREFGPDDPITREQLSTILYNYLKNYKKVRVFDSLKVNEPVTFVDNDMISDWAVEKVSMIQQIGLMQGREDGTFDPKGFVTRAEVAVVIERLNKM